MTGPREGSREIKDGIITSVPMDWHKTPAGIIPYKISARQREAAALANTVRQTDARSHVLGSLILQCYGAPPDAGTGVLSGTTNAECTPKTWSETVRAEGRNMVRHDDEWWMNNKNTWGRLAYVKDAATYPTPEVAQITPQMSPSGGGGPVDNGRASTEPMVAAAEGAARAVGGGDLRSYMAMAPGSGVNAAITTARTVPIQNAGTNRNREGYIRISAGCDRLIGTYDEIKDACAGKSDEDVSDNDVSNNDHHIVPDFTMGGTRGCREANSCRFANMPTFGDMPAICLKGFTKDRGSEHQVVQSAVNSSIADLGRTPTLSRVIEWSKKDTIQTLQHNSHLSDACAEKIRQAVDKAFAGKDLDQRVRGSTNYNEEIHNHLMAPSGQFKQY